MLTTKEAATYLGISLYYLRNMRHFMHSHEGPKFIMSTKGKGRRNKRIALYAVQDLDKWKMNHKWKNKRD